MVARERDSTQRPEELTDGDILSTPLASTPSFMLTEIWSRHATLQSSRDLAQFNREQDDTYAGARRFTSQATVDRKYAAQREERQYAYLRAQQRFQEAMQGIRNRTDDLLRRIEEQEDLAQQRLVEIRKRAIVLSDGRRVYVGEEGRYLDEDGHALIAEDAVEARIKHALHEKASTWEEKTETDRQCEEARRLKEKVLRFRDDIRSNPEGLPPEELEAAAKRYEETLTGYEARFHGELEARSPSTDSSPDYGSADYMAAYTTSFASTLDAKRPGLRDEFKPAAAGDDTTKPSEARPGTPVPRGLSL